VRITPSSKEGCLKYERLHLEFKIVLEERESELGFCYKKKMMSLESQPGILEGPKDYPFSFSEFERPVETFRSHFGRMRYYLKAVITQKGIPELSVEKDIAVYLNSDRQQIRLVHINVSFQGRLVFSFNLDKRGYFINNTIIGKIERVEGSPKLKKLSITLNQHEIFNMSPDSDVVRSLVTVFDTFDLTPQLLEEDQYDKSIPFRIPLDKYHLIPTFKFAKDKVKYQITYTLKVFVTEKEGKMWSFEYSLILWREKDVR